MILSQGEEEASRRLVDAGKSPDVLIVHCNADNIYSIAIRMKKKLMTMTMMMMLRRRITMREMGAGKGSSAVSMHLSYLQAVSKVKMNLVTSQSSTLERESRVTLNTNL